MTVTESALSDLDRLVRITVLVGSDKSRKKRMNTPHVHSIPAMTKLGAVKPKRWQQRAATLSHNMFGDGDTSSTVG